jgi:Txe/YoeB family toxin of Txe-Axe toxin-antitoxin module
MTMPLRKHAHFHKPTDRAYLIQDINDWIREVTRDPTDGLPENTKMTRHELETICRAITYSRQA